MQGEQFTGEVADALASADPGAALLALDEKFAKSSSLNNLERNHLLVNAAIDHAWSKRDAGMLDAVPSRFLNADTKAALAKTKQQLADRDMSDLRMVQELKEIQRAEKLRGKKLEIIGNVVDGKTVDPGHYRDDPEAFAFAIQMRGVPVIRDDVSAARALTMRQTILDGATKGEMPSLNALLDKVAADRSMNPKERQALMADLPKLVEGRNLMADDMVRQPVSDRLSPRLHALESSTNSAIQSLLTGRNLRSEVMKGYDLDIRRSFMAEFEETGKWPTGHRKLELIDRAVDRAEKRLEDATRITGGSASGKPSAAPAAAPAPTPAPAPSAATKALPKGVTKLD